MYDLHSHILPGVDDGARSVEETVAMARVAADNGTTVILATPHSKDVNENWSADYVRKLVRDVNAELQSNGIELTLLPGMETHLELYLPEWVTDGRALPINDTRYILVELPFFGHPNYAEEVLFQLQLQGLTPVLAHPERIEVIQNNPDMLAGFVRRGMLSQITAGSLLGYFGEDVRRFTVGIMERGLVHVIASDAHFADGPRSPKLLPGVEAAAKIVGEERALAMVVDVPKAILEGLPVQVDRPEEAQEPRRWWRPWRS